MQYKEQRFYLCQVPLGAEGPSDVNVITRAESMEDFPRVFKEYESLRAHALNDDALYSVIRADEIDLIIRTTDETSAKEKAFEEAVPSLITNLQHRVMQDRDQNAQQILNNVHGIETSIES